MRTDDEVTAAAERTAEVLAGHQPMHQIDGDYGEKQWIECSCGDDLGVRKPGHRDEDDHRAHQAAALHDADLLADPDAERERDEALAAVERVRARIRRLNPPDAADLPTWHALHQTVLLIVEGNPLTGERP